MVDKKYVVLIVLAVVMFFAMDTLSKIKEPLKEMALLPKCQQGDVVLTKDLMNGVRHHASNHIMNSTGATYFEQHYHYMDTSYSLSDCVFLVKYVYNYDELHEIMSVRIRAISQNRYDVLQVSAFLMPVEINLTPDEAEAIAIEQNISYDYVNTEIVLSAQTIIYKFYKTTPLQGNMVVLEIDAQSKQIMKIERPKELIPIV